MVGQWMVGQWMVGRAARRWGGADWNLTASLPRRGGTQAWTCAGELSPNFLTQRRFRMYKEALGFRPSPPGVAAMILLFARLVYV